MNNRLSTRRFIPAALLAFGLAAGVCLLPESASAQHGMHERGGMQMDTAMMRRHMHEADSMVAHMRREVNRMRHLAPEQWHAHMSEYSATVDSMFAMMQRHKREMDRAMEHPQMRERMGGQMHEQMVRMMSEMTELHSEARQLRNAPPSELRRRMPAHLERMDRMLKMMEEMHARHRGK